MGKFRKIKNENTEKKSLTLSPEKKRLMFTVIINSIFFTAIYFGACYGITDPSLWFIPIFLPVLYWIVLAGFVMVYIIYNRAFTRKNLTVDMLPYDWSKEQKEEYIESGKKRWEKSKWMLCVIIPLLVPVALDALYLFTLPIIQGLFGINS